MHTVDGGPHPGPPSAFYPPFRRWCPAPWTTIGTSTLGTSSTLLQRDILEAQLLRGDLSKCTLSMVSHALDHHRHSTPLFAHGVPPHGPPSAPLHWGHHRRSSRGTSLRPISSAETSRNAHCRWCPTPWTTIGVLPPFSPMVSRLMDHHQHSVGISVGISVSTRPAPRSTPAQRRGSSAAKNLQKSFRFLDKSAIFVLVDGPASTDSELFVRFVFWRFVWNSGLSLQII